MLSQLSMHSSLSHVYPVQNLQSRIPMGAAMDQDGTNMK